MAARMPNLGDSVFLYTGPVSNQLLRTLDVIYRESLIEFNKIISFIFSHLKINNIYIIIIKEGFISSHNKKTNKQTNKQTENKTKQKRDTECCTRSKKKIKQQRKYIVPSLKLLLGNTNYNKVQEFKNRGIGCARRSQNLRHFYPGT